MPDFKQKAVAAEARDDWDRAAMWWHYAARVAPTRQEAKAYCWQREDAAKARALEAACG